ncbi:MAG TPA: LamG-like jellyroll fold domain-containing protein [Ktedonobacteraceae bacterium]|nr:LamG-like jellyroll fold domain-containing protein [Ktedonobacteraceae bacterium]
MSVDISIGSALISNSLSTYSYNVWQDAVTNLTIAAASPSNPRIDVVVAYINLSAVSTTNSNNPGALAFMDVQGIPGSSPVAPNSSAIQTAVGAGVPWIALANVTVPQSATQIVTANIADVRSPFAVRANLWGGSSNTYGHTVPNVADDTVVLANAIQTLNNKTLGNSTSIIWTGWQPASGSFTYAGNNGNKEFLLNTSANLTGVIQPGDKLSVVRGTVPPTQCMSFVSGSSQYATNTSPSGITFTSAFTCEAWVYLNSYGGSTGEVIVNRRNGNSGCWEFMTLATGQVRIMYGDASGNFTSFDTYQSLPLKRWIHVAGVVSSVSSKTGAVYINTTVTLRKQGIFPGIFPGNLREPKAI